MRAVRSQAAGTACDLVLIGAGAAVSECRHDTTTGLPRHARATNGFRASAMFATRARSRAPVTISCLAPKARLLCIRHGGELLGLILARQSVGQLEKVPVDDCVDLVERQIDAVVGHPALRKVVGANALAAVAAADQ